MHSLLGSRLQLKVKRSTISRNTRDDLKALWSLTRLI